MAIKTVQATINGVPTTLTLNQSTGSYDYCSDKIKLQSKRWILQCNS